MSRDICLLFFIGFHYDRQKNHRSKVKMLAIFLQKRSAKRKFSIIMVCLEEGGAISRNVGGGREREGEGGERGREGGGQFPVLSFYIQLKLTQKYPLILGKK